MLVKRVPERKQIGWMILDSECKVWNAGKLVQTDNFTAIAAVDMLIIDDIG